MNNIARKIHILRAVAVVTYKEWSAYRTHSMVSILVGPLFFAVQMIIWSAVYSGGQSSINGMTLTAMLSYYGISTLIHYLTMDFADWNLQMLIHTGKYLTFALRPIHHRFFALAQKVGHRVLGFVFEFLPVLLILVLVFEVDMVPSSAVWFVISVFFSFLITFYINYSVGLLGFWITKNAGIRSAVKLIISLSSGMLIPLSFFPGWCQKLFFVLPFQHTVYVPSMVFTGQYSLAGESLSIPAIVAVQGIFVLLTFALTELLYRLGNKRFTGVGA
ncbi:MAG: ABC transporter permease [Eubacteriales bacterium]